MRVLSVFCGVALLTACGGEPPNWQGEWGLVQEDGSSPAKAVEIIHEPQTGVLLGSYRVDIVGEDDSCVFPDDWGYDRVSCQEGGSWTVLSIKGDQLTFMEDDGDSFQLVRIE